MKLSDFDYKLPRELIAQEPIKPRDHSWLLVVKKCGFTNSVHPNEGSDGCEIEHKHFYDIVDYLEPGDVLVLNNSKVFPARLIGKKKETGGKIEVFLLPSPLPILSPLVTSRKRELGRKAISVYHCLVGGSRKREGLEVKFKLGLRCKLIKDNGDGTWEVEFNKSIKEMMKVVEKIGEVPLPPYIKRGKGCPTPKGVTDTKSYQTVYADDRKVGSVAAPTAGFHFTPRLMKKLKAKGVHFEYITLHVGLGTFAPVKVENIKKHKMHAEFVEVKKGVINRIVKAKKEGRRVVAVGTTSVRTLEAVFSKLSIINYPSFALRASAGKQLSMNDQFSMSKLSKQISDFKGMVDIFIYPGYRFNVVDAMITNFHLPKSTLLMLVSAFATKRCIDQAYKEAINKKYRFYSYGDAMLIF